MRRFTHDDGRCSRTCHAASLTPTRARLCAEGWCTVARYGVPEDQRHATCWRTTHDISLVHPRHTVGSRSRVTGARAIHLDSLAGGMHLIVSIATLDPAS